jgi:superfamily II DNA or RNA helicase
MIPRRYQVDCVDAVEKGFETFNRLLAVLPTGAGKTIIFSFLAQKRRQRGERVLILAHREELIDQAIAKLHSATGIIAQKEKAEHKASLSASVVVASVQTMIRRLDKWPSDHFGLVVADEAHHAISSTWQTVLKHFDTHTLGVTATPDRGDKKELGSFFESIAFEISLIDLIQQGFLAPITFKSLPLRIDLNNVGMKAGDFDDTELGAAIEPYFSQIVGHIKTSAPNRRCLVFLPLIATSEKFVAECEKQGIRACHVDGYCSDRRARLHRFGEGDFDLLSNAMLLTEGYDEPSIDCVIPLRPTRSRPLYAQQIGRGTRMFPLKDNLLVLDFLWMHAKHKLCRPAHLIAGCEDEADIITEIAEAGRGDVELDLIKVSAEAQSKREEALLKKLKEQENKKAKFISAEQFAMSHGSLEAAEFQATMPWESDAVSGPQRRYLKEAGIDVESVTGKGHATKLLNIYFANKPLQLATPKQRAAMRRRGHPNWQQATKREAAQFFAASYGKE